MIKIGDREYFTEKEWAEFRGISVDSLRVARCRGKDAPSVKIGRTVYYKKSTVDAWLDELEGRHDNDD